MKAMLPGEQPTRRDNSNKLSEFAAHGTGG